jgi:hypothetical protein
LGEKHIFGFGLINKNLKNIKIMKITFIIGCLFNVFGLVIIIKGRIPFI